MEKKNVYDIGEKKALLMIQDARSKFDLIKIFKKLLQKKKSYCFPDVLVVENSPCNTEDTGSIPGLGRSCMPQGNWAHVPHLQSLCSRTCEPQLLSLRAAATEASTP